MTLVTFDYPDGQRYRGCEHMAVWLPLFSELCRQRGIVRSHLDVAQVYGNAAASAKTHLDGTAADVWQDDKRVAELAREAGAPASWPRGPKYGQTMDVHTHMTLDCGCSAYVDYQIPAVKAGYNGLGLNGRGGSDYIKTPSVWRNYTTGVAWMRDRIEELSDMKMTDTFTRPDGHTGTVGSFFAYADQRLEELEKVVYGGGIKKLGGPTGTTDLAKEAAWNHQNIARLLAAIKAAPDQAAIDRIIAAFENGQAA